MIDTRCQQEGLLLIIDREKLTAKGRAEAVNALRQAAGQLED